MGELPQNVDPHDPVREAAAAESETEQLVICMAIAAAHELGEGDDIAPQADTNAPPVIARGLKEGVPITPGNPKTTRPPKGGLSSVRQFAMKEIWSGRRGSNPRPRPWQGRALPLSYTRIRDGGERAPSTADLCQMPNVNATVRMRSDAARISRFHQQWLRIGPKHRRTGVCRPRLATRRPAASATPGDSSHFSVPPLRMSPGSSSPCRNR